MYKRFDAREIKSILVEAGVPEELHEQAIASVIAGYNKANGFKALLHNLTAPFVVPFALLTCKWDSEEITNRFFRGYNNDATINGDAYIWEGDIAYPVPLEKDSQEAIALNYWLKGTHPRSFAARYIWLGIRNRGKQAYMKPEEENPRLVTHETWGKAKRGETVETTTFGWEVQRMGSYWEINGVHEFHGNWVQQTRWGWKLGLWKYHRQYFDKKEIMSVGVNIKFRKLDEATPTAAAVAI